MVYCRDCVYWVPAGDLDERDRHRGRACYHTWEHVTRADSERARECSDYRSLLLVCRSLVRDEGLSYPGGGGCGGGGTLPLSVSPGPGDL